MAKKTAKINAGSVDALIKLFGSCDENINMIKDKLDVEVVNNKGEFCFSGEEENVDAALEVTKKLLNYIGKGEEADIGRVSYICDCALDGRLDEIDQLLNDVVAVTFRGKLIKSKTVGQKKYVDAIKKNTVTIGVGPAGTGKTYLAVALAVSALKEKRWIKSYLRVPPSRREKSSAFCPATFRKR